MKTESVKIEKKLADEIRKIARSEGRTFSGQIRILLERALSLKEDYSASQGSQA